MLSGHLSISNLMLDPPITTRKLWSDTVNSKFLPLEFHIRQQEGFSAQIDMLDRTWQLAIVRTQAHRVSRTRHLAERADQGFFKVFWLLDGHCEIEQGNNRALLNPGEWALYDTTRPYAIEFGHDTQFLVFLLPYASCTGLLSASVLAWIDRNDPSGRRIRLPDAQRYVLDHIGDASLTPERLASALNVSRRTLYAGFHTHGLTPASFILETRLERCRTTLADPAHHNHTITQIALDHGFCDGAHFSRLFKARYGMTPRQWRESK